jgi:hypothetical protein
MVVPLPTFDMIIGPLFHSVVTPPRIGQETVKDVVYQV